MIQWTDSIYPDVLNIPEAMVMPYTIVKGAAWAIFGLLFVLAILSQTIWAISKDGPNYRKTIVTAVLIAVGLGWYEYIFMKIIALCEIIAMSISDVGGIGSVALSLGIESSEQVEGAFGGIFGKIFGKINIIANLITPKAIITYVLSICIKIIEPIFLIIRYALLCILYVIGPLTFVCYIFNPTKVMLKGWFTNVLQISFWIVVLRIIEAVMVGFSIESFTQQGQVIDFIPWLIICVIFLVLIILTPMITGKILSGQNLGEVGSLIIAIATVIPAKYAVAKKFAEGAAKVGAAGIREVKKTSSWGVVKSVGTGVSQGIKSGYDKIRDKIRPRPRR